MFKRNKKPAKRTAVLFAVLVLLLMLAVGGTVAWFTDSATKENAFLPSQVSCSVSEVNTTSVTVTHTGDIDAFVRAAVTVNWVDASGNVYGTAPQYVVGINEADWAAYTDGYYYCLEALAPGGVSENLITGIVATSAAPEGYTLGVEVIAEAIQSEPVHAAGTAWGVVISAGSVSAYTG